VSGFHTGFSILLHKGTALPARVRLRVGIILTAACVGAAFPEAVFAQMPPAISAPGESAIATFHAEGAQIYECKAGTEAKLAWTFREPIATLLLDGMTVGRHYAGPTWEHADGSIIVGKAVANAPGKTQGDIAWLKLEVLSRRGSGALAGITSVQRINTRGGVRSGSCENSGSFYSAPYSADYVFLRKDG
jgi:hypothetical protein